MREIKFRAWDKESEKMVDAPYFFELDHFSDEKRIHHIQYRYYEDWRDLEDGKSHSCELMQWTGLKDVDGKDIYEGDILVHFGIMYYVEYDKNGVWMLRGMGLRSLPNGEDTPIVDEMLCNEYKVLEIMGNIFEHPELRIGKD